MQCLSTQGDPLPTPTESQPTKRQLAQRARRQRELAARLLAAQSTTPQAIQPLTLRQHAQSARRNRGRAILEEDHVEQPGSITANPLPTPSPTQSYLVNRRARRGAQERVLHPTATSPTPEPGDNPNPEVNQPNRRQVAQRLRRERERAARAAAAAAASNQQASGVTSSACLVTPAPSQASERSARQTATGSSNPTGQPVPPNPLSPPSMQQVSASRKLTIMKIDVCFLIL